MNKKDSPSVYFDKESLRQRAESQVTSSHTDVTVMSTEEIKTLVHELEVHQIELELQNEELRETQDALYLEHDRYMNLYEFAPIGYLTLDKERIITDVNLSATTSLGLTRNQIIGERLDKFAHKDSSDGLFLHLREVQNSGKSTSAQFKFNNTNGQPFWARVVTISKSNEANDDTTLLVAMIDITQGVEAVHKLERNEKELTLILDNSPESMVILDKNCRILRANQQMLNMNKSANHDVAGMGCGDVFCCIHALENPEGCGASEACETCPVRLAVIDTLRTGNAHMQEEHEISIRHNGKNKTATLLVSSVLIPLYDDEPRVLVTLQDVSTIRNLQKRLRQSEKIEAIGQLAGGIAHQFNNILAGIMGATEIIEGLASTGDEAKKYTDMIFSQAERAAYLTKQLLAFSRNQSSELYPVEVNSILKDTQLLLESTLDRRITISENLTEKDCWIIGDTPLLQSALLNLTINASHSMPDGGSISINSSLLELDQAYCDASSFDIDPGAYLDIKVRDTGTGIPASDLPKIFDPFFTTKEQGQGTGLGLAAVYGVIQQHNGEILIISEIGSGTTVHVLLPLTDEKTAKDSKDSERIHGMGRILVADDEEVLRTTAKLILEDLGYKVVLAENGKEALDIFSKNPAAFDLILLDMVMPEMSGHDCFKEMKMIAPESKIIIASGFTPEEDLEKMKSEGLCAFINKPFRSSALSQVVHDALSAGVKP